jgi:hypothetical protein
MRKETQAIIDQKFNAAEFLHDIKIKVFGNSPESARIRYGFYGNITDGWDKLFKNSEGYYDLKLP